VAQWRHSLAFMGKDDLVEPFFCVKFCVSNNSFSAHPWSGKFFKIIQAVPVAVFMDYSVFNSEASSAYGNGCFSVWFAHDVTSGSFAVGYAWVGQLEESRVNADTLVPPSSSRKLD
jgi:hypothetical protein